MTPGYTVVIPTLNEAENIGRCVAAVHALCAGVEVIVADGGSRDGTAGLAAAAGARICQAPRGRGLQCNRGAALASGDVLLFLHADTRLPANAFDLLDGAFADPQVQVGTFRLSFDERHWLFSIYTALSRFDSVLTTFGDQCIVIRRSFFQALGGFPEWQLFEDVALLQQARCRTRVHSFPAAVVTSSRRFQKEGVLRQSLRNGWYVLLYLLGVAPEELALRYERSRAQ